MNFKERNIFEISVNIHCRVYIRRMIHNCIKICVKQNLLSKDNISFIFKLIIKFFLENEILYIILLPIANPVN